MLRQNKKIILVFVILIVSCQEKKDGDRILELDRISLSTSIETVTQSIYNEVHKLATDTLMNWVDVGLKSSMNLKVNTWKMDSLICFNRNKDKFITAIKVQLTKYKDTDHDGMYFLYGVKIKEEWYFFFGPYMVLPRIAYGYPSNTPLPFTKLHEIAMDTIFKGYLKKNKKGEWEINDDFFGDFTSGAYGGNGPKTQAQWDSVYLQVVKNNWKSRDTTEYGSVQ